MSQYRQSTCEECHEDFTFDSWNKRIRRFCSNACAARHTSTKAAQAARVRHLIDYHLRNPKDRCFSCGQWFQPKQSSKYPGTTITCSVECGHEFQRWAASLGQDPWKDAPLTRVRPCQGCGTLTLSSRTYCQPCASTRKAAYNRSYRRRRKLMGVEYKDRLQAKFESYGTKIVQPGITWFTVAQRDGMTCQVCSVECHPPRGKNEPTEATLGHRIALALGGDHTWQNAFLECRSCNVERGAKLDKIARSHQDQQRRLASAVGTALG